MFSYFKLHTSNFNKSCVKIFKGKIQLNQFYILNNFSQLTIFDIKRTN